VEILFYCLERKSLEDVLPGLLERTCERGWRALVRVDSPERLNALDLHLWTYSDQSFLAHGTPEFGFAGQQPVYLTTGEENPNGAKVIFLAGAGVPSDWAGRTFDGIDRVVVLFDGLNPELRDAAYRSWRTAATAGHAAAFWKQNAAGKWEQEKPSA
jgi:DNA polymerase-3 subunit chi